MLWPPVLLLLMVILCNAVSPIQDNKDKVVKDFFPGIGEYVLDSVARNWTEAFEHCVELRGHLAVINSVAEKEALLSMMSKYQVPSIHLGFHDRFIEGTYYTVKNEPIDVACDVTLWAPGYPTNSTSNNCGQLTTVGLTDIDCDVKQASICEYPKSLRYDLIPGHGYYKYHPEERTWPEAWAMCQSEGGYLHVLNSEAERDALYRQYDYRFVWVGVHRLIATNNEGFVTIFNEPLSSTGFDTWIIGNPFDTYLNKPYVVSQGDFGLYTTTRVFKHEFICEMENKQFAGN